MPYLDSLDIANRALQHCGQAQIQSVIEDSKANVEASFAYDKVRRAELRRNTWRFSIRNGVLRAMDTTTMLLVPAVYNATVTYLSGAIVQDANGQYWMSNEPENINNTPGDTDVWDMYFGPLTVSLYSATATYFAGELVYAAGTNPGSYNVYLSLQSGNSDNPTVATAYSSTATYQANDVVSYGGSNWRGLIPFNLGTTPADGPLSYDAGQTYTTAQTVTASNNFIYSSVGTGNIGYDPVTDGGVHWTNTNVAKAWSRTPTVVTSSTKWRYIAATIKNPHFLYPIGSGPSRDPLTRNVFRLPCGFLKKAPQDPKAGSVSYLGASTELSYDDWNLAGDYLVSADTGPLVLRFVADVTRVTAMDDMFCEGLACRVGLAIIESMAQSTTKLQAIAAEYKEFMGQARLTNAIEIGSEEPPMDDWVACRA